MQKALSKYRLITIHGAEITREQYEEIVRMDFGDQAEDIIKGNYSGVNLANGLQLQTYQELNYLAFEWYTDEWTQPLYSLKMQVPSILDKADFLDKTARYQINIAELPFFLNELINAYLDNTFEYNMFLLRYDQEESLQPTKKECEHGSENYQNCEVPEEEMEV